MKKNRLVLITGITALLGIPHVFAADAAATEHANFPYQVEFEFGKIDFAPGDSITITEMRGTSPTISTNQTYSIIGNYVLQSRDEAKLSFFSTVPNSGPTPVDPQQILRITKGAGTFRLSKTVPEDGFLHVSFYPVPTGNEFGGVYFGQGEWVLREKKWTHSEQSGRLPQAHGSLCDYLGEAVAPPSNLDIAYSLRGLSDAVQMAAANAGVTLKRVIIDDSEFPFIIGVVSEAGDFDKVSDQLKKLNGYDYGGSVGTSTHHAFNIIPWPVFPSEASQRIGRRLTIREQMLMDKMMSLQ